MNWQGRRSVTLPWLPAVIIATGVGLYVLLTAWAIFRTALDVVIVGRLLAVFPLAASRAADANPK